MGWSLGGPDQHGRYIGYGVPAFCDAPNCTAQINRGLAYVCCDQEPYGGERGCGLYFCEKHHDGRGRCSRCRSYRPCYSIAKPEHPAWLSHLLRDYSWAEWRGEDAERVEQFESALTASLVWCVRKSVVIDPAHYADTHTTDPDASLPPSVVLVPSVPHSEEQ